MDLTKDAEKQRGKSNRIRRLKSGTQIIELERKKVASAAISVRGQETRMRCQVIQSGDGDASTSSTDETGWVDVYIKPRVLAWKEVPSTV
eukprot:COSAG06_NODE_20430_length_796_cov_1.065997_1_plen_89_part_10